MSSLLIILALLTQDLNAAIEKTTKLDRYTFEASFESDTDLDDVRAEGRFQKNRGFHVAIGDHELYRMGRRAAYRISGEEWKTGEPEDAPRFEAPHEDVKRLGPFVKSLEETDETERFGGEMATLHRGALTPKGAADLLRFKELTRKHPKAKVGGSVRIWIGESGVIVKYVIEITIRDGDEFEAHIVQTLELDELNDAEIRIPEETVKPIKSAPAKKTRSARKTQADEEYRKMLKAKGVSDKDIETKLAYKRMEDKLKAEGFSDREVKRAWQVEEWRAAGLSDEQIEEKLYHTERIDEMVEEMKAEGLSDKEIKEVFRRMKEEEKKRD